MVSKDPKLFVSPSGVVYLLSVYGEEKKARVGLAISHDGGDSFGPVSPISEPNRSVSSHGENSPSLIGTPGAIGALWEQTSGESGSELMFARSVNFGRSFETPVHVTDKNRPSFNGFSSLGVAPDGSVYAVWLDGRDPAEIPGTFSVYLARSTDRGGTFGRNIRVAGTACPCCRPRLAFGSGGEVYVVWRKVYPGDIRDMAVSRSTDGGETFLPPARVAEDHWRINGCPHSGAAAVRAARRLYVAWLTEAAAAAAGVKLSWSDDGGETFAPPLLASGKILDANHPEFSVSQDGRVLLVFQGRDPANKEGWSSLEPYFVEIASDGRATPPLPIPGNSKSISYPTVAAGSAGRVFVAWSEPDEKGSGVVLVRGRKEFR